MKIKFSTEYLSAAIGAATGWCGSIFLMVFVFNENIRFWPAQIAVLVVGVFAPLVIPPTLKELDSNKSGKGF